MKASDSVDWYIKIERNNELWVHSNDDSEVGTA